MAQDRRAHEVISTMSPTEENVSHRFRTIFRPQEPLLIDGLEMLAFGEAAAVNYVWPRGFKFACSFTHSLNGRSGHLQLDCISRGNVAMFEILGSSCSGIIGLCRNPSEILRCRADSVYHDMKNPAEFGRRSNIPICKRRFAHRSVDPKSDLLLVDRHTPSELLLRQDVAELIVERDSLRSKVSFQKISDCPWSHSTRVSEHFVGRKYASCISPLVCNLILQNSGSGQCTAGWGDLNGREFRGKLLELHSGRKRDELSIPGMLFGPGVPDIERYHHQHIETFVLPSLKRKGPLGTCRLLLPSPKRQQGAYLVLVNRSETNPHGQRGKDRENVRLGRLLRRAAELDVSRCCNDVRTLLMARAQCEEANLQVCPPPSIEGNLPEYSHFSIPQIKKQTMLEELRSTEPIPQARWQDSRTIAFYITDLLALLSPTYRFSGHELSAALKIPGYNDRLLGRTASALVRTILPALVHVIGLDKSLRRSVELLSTNDLIWPSLARMCLLLYGYQELGLSEVELAPEIIGVEQWSVHSDYGLSIETSWYTDVSTQKKRVFDSFAEFRICMPIPRRARARYSAEKRTGKLMSANQLQVYGAAATIKQVLRIRPCDSDKLNEILQDLLSPIPRDLPLCALLHKVEMLLQSGNYCSFHHFLGVLSSRQSISEIKYSGPLLALKALVDKYLPFRGLSILSHIGVGPIGLPQQDGGLWRLHFCCWSCGMHQGYSCSDSMPLFQYFEVQSPLESSYFCSGCLKNNEYSPMGHVVQLGISTFPCGKTTQMSDFLVSLHGPIAGLGASGPHSRLVAKTQSAASADFYCLRHAITALSQGIFNPSQSTWSDILSSLVNASTTFAEIQNLSSTSCVARRENSDKFSLNLSHVSEEQTSLDNRRRQWEAYLTSDVILRASTSLSGTRPVFSNNIAPYAVPQTALAAPSGSAGQSHKSKRIQCLLGADAGTEEEGVACLLCGGDYGYLTSLLKIPHEPHQQKASYSTSLDRRWRIPECLGFHPTHEFCYQTLHSFCTRWSNRRLQQRKTAQEKSVQLGNKGRLTPIGLDQAGFLYWRLATDPWSIHIQRQHESASHAWSSHRTLPVISQVARHLRNTINDRGDNLQQLILRLYPEVDSILEHLCLDSDGAQLCQSIETALQALPTDDYVDYPRTESKTRHQVGDIVFVRRTGMLWRTRVLASRVCDDGHRVYWTCYHNWSIAFDCCYVRDEIVVPAKSIFSVAQQNLHHSRMLTVNSDHFLPIFQSSNLIAANFIGVPHRTASSPPASIFDSSPRSEIAQIRAAILTVEAALPLGSKQGWTDETFVLRTQMIEQATAAIELIELVFMLEDELELTYLDPRWISARRSFPSRSYLLQNPSPSWATLLIYLLDGAIFYTKCNLCANNAE